MALSDERLREIYAHYGWPQAHRMDLATGRAIATAAAEDMRERAATECSNRALQSGYACAAAIRDLHVEHKGQKLNEGE